MHYLSYRGIIMKNPCFALMCFLCCLKGALFGTEVTEKKNISFKFGENVTLHAEDCAAEEIKEMVWTKGPNTFFKCSEDKTAGFLNDAYKSIRSHNISSITICHATGNDTGTYTAQITYINRTNKYIFYYVREFNDFCEGTTHVNGTEGQAVDLHVKGFTNASKWSKDNITDIMGNASNNSENGKLKQSGNGTLSINNLTKEDEGSYTVNIKPSNALLECNHTYILSILSLGVNASTSNFCGGTTYLNGTEGQAADLPVKGFTNVSGIRWSKDNITDIMGNTSNNSENGKLKMSDNGTLSINNLTKEDEGTYTVNIKPSDECNHTYVLSIGVNASTSNSSDGTTNGTGTEEQAMDLLVKGIQIWPIVAIIGAVIGAGVLVIAAIYIYRKEIRLCRPKHNHQPVPQLQETIPLNSNSLQNAVGENEEETAT